MAAQPPISREDVFRLNQLELFDLVQGKSFADQLTIHVDFWGTRAKRHPGDGHRDLGRNSFLEELAMTLGLQTTRRHKPQGAGIAVRAPRPNLDNVRRRYREWMAGGKPQRKYWLAICKVLFGGRVHWFPYFFLLRNALRELEGNLQDETSRGVDPAYEEEELDFNTWLQSLGAEDLRQMQCYRVTDPRGPDLYAVHQLHARSFGGVPELADSHRDLVRWMIADNEADPNDLDRCHEITITLKRAGRTTAYVMAQSYPSTGFTFIGYAVVQHRKISEFQALSEMLKVLVVEVEKLNPEWRAIIGEMELSAFQKRPGRDQSQFTAFSLRAKRFVRATNSHAKFFALNLPYMQPLVDPDQLGTNHEKSPHLNQRLVVFCRNPDIWPTRTKDGTTYLTSIQAREMFEVLIKRWYGDISSRRDYQRHLQNRLNGILESIGDRTVEAGIPEPI